MRTTSTVLLVAAAALLASAVAAARPQQSADPTIREVMTTMTAPGSDAVFGAAADPPTTADGWDAVRKGAVLLEQSGALLMTGSRVKDSTTWMERARALVAEAGLARQAAEKKNQEAIEQAGDRVYATCEECHARYLTSVAGGRSRGTLRADYSAPSGRIPAHAGNAGVSGGKTGT